MHRFESGLDPFFFNSFFTASDAVKGLVKYRQSHILVTAIVITVIIVSVGKKTSE